MPESVDGAVPKFIIQEMSGDERLVELSQRALPFRPFTLKGEQRRTVDWYPGSPIASLQVLGPKETPTTIKGRWSDRFIMKGGYGVSAPGLDTSFDPGANQAPAIVDGEPVENVLALFLLFDDIRRKGQLLNVSWMELSRFGVLAEFEGSFDTANEISWTAMFDWTSQGEDPTQARVLVATADTTNLPQQAQRSLRQTLTSAAASAFAVANDVQVAISSAADTIQSTIDTIQTTVENAIDNLTAPLDAARALAGTTSSLVASYNEVMEFATERIQTETDMGTYLTRMAKTLATRSQARAARDEAAIAQRALLNQIDPEIIAVFNARQDDDLRFVSSQFYGTPDAWKSLMLYNGLSSSRLFAGMVILVPKRPA